MKYVSNDGVVLDSSNEDNITKKIYTFSPKKSDYMLSHFITWNIILTEYTFSVDGNKIHLPSSVYLFCSDGDGMFDWISTDEMINRRLAVFQMSCDFRKWKLSEIALTGQDEVRTFMPKTDNIIPVADSGDQYFMYMAYSDPVRKHKNVDFLSSFVF